MSINGLSLISEKIECNICPAKCSLKDKAIGLCGIISNNNGMLVKSGEGRISSAVIEPIEKKPLYHYYPGHKTLSLGFYGCNMACQYCQNHKVSHAFPVRQENGTLWTPERTVTEAATRGVKIICFTYTETLMYYEYIKSVFELTRQHGIKVVVSTNAYFMPEYWAECVKYVDALNIDIKTPSVFKEDEAFNNAFDRNVLRIDSKYRIIVDNLKYAISKGIPVECSLLVTESSYDDESAILIAGKLSEIDCDIPIHLLKYHPAGLTSMISTSDEKMDRVYEIFYETMNYVYVGFGNGNQNTMCPNCGKDVIVRNEYEIVSTLNGDKCECGYIIPIGG